MAVMYPATCPDDGAPVAGTLASAPDVPIYACGGYGSDPHATVRHLGELITSDRNLVGLSPDDVAYLSDVVGVAATLAVADVWLSDPRIAIGSCGHVTIDGECLAVIDPVLDQ